MPQIEDLPQVAQNQLRAARDAQAGAIPESRRKSLLEKLAAFGITRHDDEAAPRQAAVAPPAPPRTYATPVAQPDFNRGQPRPLPPRAPAAPAPAASLDAHGRPAHRPPTTEDDQLDIPAFLRRQQN